MWEFGLDPWFTTGHNSVPQWVFGNVWRQFWMKQLGGRGHGTTDI